ncbi:hypothetical protein BDA99DRAFT_505252 [Phascolomyces articulosus]|uniref:Uncharacterized protein n=1 Tax=Phascolomyces articulosus TaxID=60185 RepID=A0AAD5KEM5_9FUNG|nr:hypothetical protein BDA99DRAFT_505252 [Phascolomyces articulosus]
MNYFPSPPSSPSPFEHLDDPDYVATDNEPSIVCGSCNKALGADWFCSNCHKKCSTCSRILALNTDDYCTRCWVYVPSQNTFVPRQKYLPSPTSSTTSSSSSTCSTATHHSH